MEDVVATATSSEARLSARTLVGTNKAYHCGLDGSAAATLSRLCRGLDDVVISTLVASRWRRNCTSLDLALSDLADSGAENVRLVVRQHVRGCEQCQESERRFVSPTEVFGGLATMPAPPPLRRELLKRLKRSEPQARSSRLRRLTFGILSA
jgi:hypothetical protein